MIQLSSQVEQAIGQKKDHHNHQRPFATVARRKDFRKEISRSVRLAPLLHFERGKRSHSANRRDSGKDSACSRSSALPVMKETDRPNCPISSNQKTSDDAFWGSPGKHAIYMHKLVKYLGKATDSDRKLLLSLTQRSQGATGECPS